MDSNDLWQEHVNGLTKQVAYLLQKTHELESRLEYYEEVFIILNIEFSQNLCFYLRHTLPVS